LVRGPISRVLNELEQERGEFTVVVDIGHMTANRVVTGFTPSMLTREFGDLTVQGGLTRRQAIAQLSRRHHVSAKEVYAALEQAKKSGE
jgi:16S rRNA C1402 (ribose-2'-O) methylase RsmI